MTTQISSRRPDAAAIERVLMEGDLSALNPEQRLSYLNQVCESLGLNPLTKPFAYLKLSGKTVLYALRDAAEQLRKLHGVSITEMSTSMEDGVYVVQVKAQDKTGRTDISTGAVSVVGLKGENLANALLKAETKAKRRVTLSICGLGMLDETEVESIADRCGYSVSAPAMERQQIEQPMAANEPDGMPVKVAGRQPPTPVLDPVGSASLTIQRVDRKPTKNANVTKFVVVLSDGREVTTIKTQLGDLAEALVQEGCPVAVETKSSKWGEDLTSLRRDVPAKPGVLDSEWDGPTQFPDKDVAF